ncbi:hypothetical protein CAPN004_05870 [Capnocytophaga cynodegmi]|nr:hypothetical protein CAPN004_05870 [Capnocytophaga cynodegmi]
MNTKHIEKIVRPGTPHFVGDGFRVHNFIPGTSSMNFFYGAYGSLYNDGL